MPNPSENMNIAQKVFYGYFEKVSKHREEHNAVKLIGDAIIYPLICFVAGGAYLLDLTQRHK